MFDWIQALHSNQQKISGACKFCFNDESRNKLDHQSTKEKRKSKYFNIFCKPFDSRWAFKDSQRWFSSSEARIWLKVNGRVVQIRSHPSSTLFRDLPGSRFMKISLIERIITAIWPLKNGLLAVIKWLARCLLVSSKQNLPKIWKVDLIFWNLSKKMLRNLELNLSQRFNRLEVFLKFGLKRVILRSSVSTGNGLMDSALTY